MKSLLAASILGLSLCVSAAQAQYDETRIRQSDQNTRVVGYNGSWTPYTISGVASDYIVTPFYCGPLGSAPFIVERIPNSGGQTSFRFCVPFFYSWDGCIIEVWRGGRLIDGDRVRVL
jgi:hypothetical protein